VIWGTGKERRDLLYIDDLIYFVDQSIKHQENLYEVFNCGSGQSLSVEELVHKIVVASGRDLKVEHDLTMPSIDISLSLDCNKAKNELGWKPKIELDEGIERTLKWYRETRKNTFG
jgi:nucleoside-diphosphate-sugar epimerase